MIGNQFYGFRQWYITLSTARFLDSSIIPNRIHCSVKWICFHPQVKGEEAFTLLGKLETDPIRVGTSAHFLLKNEKYPLSETLKHYVPFRIQSNTRLDKVQTSIILNDLKCVINYLSDITKYGQDCKTFIQETK
jgi:hypothetical protein